MALLLPKSLFIHIPKTGGQWVRRAIGNAGIQVSESHCAWHEGQYAPQTLCNGQWKKIRHTCYHSNLEQTDCTGKFTFTFVRHPFSFYRSYWSYKMKVGWDVSNGFDHQVCDESLSGFIEKVLHLYPKRGWVSRLYQSYIDHPNGSSIDCIGKTETLADDLVVALRSAGEIFDEELLRATPPVNVHGNVSHQTEHSQLPDAVLEQILRSESYVLERFGYAPTPC